MSGIDLTGVNDALLERAASAAREINHRAALEKAAVVPPGGDPNMVAGGAPVDPAMAGGMDPAMMGGAPPMDPGAGGPPMDPGMGGAPPMDPALAGAGPDLQTMISQAVQQAMAAGGGGAAGGKGGKPDVALLLSEIKDTQYKIGMMIQALTRHSGLELPFAATLGEPPEGSDPALAQAAGSAPPGPGGGAPPEAGPPPEAAPGPFPELGGLSGDVAKEAAEAAAEDDRRLSKAAAELSRLLGESEDEDPAPAAIKTAAAPDPVGRSFGDAVRDNPRESPSAFLAEVIRRRRDG